MAGTLTRPAVVAVLALICCGLWGSAFPCIKIGYRLFQIPAEDAGAQIVFAGFRFFLAGILALLLGSLLEKRILLPPKAAAGKIVKLSMMQTVFQYLFFYLGLAHTTGVKGAIIVGSNSLVTILIAACQFRQEQLTGRKLAGCLAGLTGVVAANLAQGGLSFSFTFNGEGFVFLSVISYGFSSVFLKKYSRDYDPVLLSGWQFVLGGGILALMGTLMGGRLEYMTWQGILMLLYLGFLSAVAYSLWGILLKYNPVSKVAIYGFSNPVMGVFLSALLLGEGGQAFCLQNVIALCLVSGGIFLVNYRSKPV